MYISIYAHICIDTCVYIYYLYTHIYICIYIWIHKKQRCFHIDRCNGFSDGGPSVNWRGGVFEIGGWVHRWYCPYFDQYVCGHGRYARTHTHPHTHVHVCVCVCVCMYVYARIYIYIYIYMYICIYIYIYICTHTRICMPCERPFISAKVLDISTKEPDIFAYELYFFLVFYKIEQPPFCVTSFHVCVFPWFFWIDETQDLLVKSQIWIHNPRTNATLLLLLCISLSVLGKTLQDTATHCNTLQHTDEYDGT